MPSISIRGITKQKFQDKCKQLGLPMKKKLEEIINEVIDKQPTVREQGLKALKALGVSKKKAEAAWDSMTIEQQNSTLTKYHRSRAAAI